MSSNASSHSQMLLALSKVMDTAEYEQIEKLPENLLVGIYQVKKKEIDAMTEKETLSERKIADYRQSVADRIAEQDVDATGKKCAEVVMLRNCLKHAGLMDKINWRLFENKKWEDATKMSLMVDGITCAYLLKLVEADRDKHYTEILAKQSASKSKSKSKSGGTRQKFTGTDKFVNTPETAEGSENKYVFKGDEDAVFTKPTSTSADGTTRNIKYKAVKHQRYMGGAESKPDDGYCVGAVGWDRAKGSKAIADTGMSYAQFKIRCAGEILGENGMCAPCNKFGSMNFFTDAYKFSKGKSKAFSGLTPKEFIEQNLEYCPIAN